MAIQVSIEGANKGCPKCGAELVIDDTSNVVYCEANPDHYRSDVSEA